MMDMHILLGLTVHRSAANVSGGQDSVATPTPGGTLSGDLESLKLELLAEMRKEMNKIKDEIIEGILLSGPAILFTVEHFGSVRMINLSETVFIQILMRSTIIIWGLTHSIFPAANYIYRPSTASIFLV